MGALRHRLRAFCVSFDADSKAEMQKVAEVVGIGFDAVGELQDKYLYEVSGWRIN